MSKVDIPGLVDAFRRQDARRRKVLDQFAYAADHRPVSGRLMTPDARTLSEIDAALRRHDEAKDALRHIERLPGHVPTPAEPTTAIWRLLSGSGSHEERAWGLDRFSGFLLAKQTVSLERLFGLPTSSRARAREVRNHWLRRAAELIKAPHLKTRARLLSLEIDRFQRFRWPAWQLMKLPPEDAAPIDVLLFFGLQSADGLVRADLQWRQLLKIIAPSGALPARCDDIDASVRSEDSPMNDSKT